MELNLITLYQTDEDFAQYVDRCASTRHISVDRVLSLMMTKNYAEWLIQSKEGKTDEIQ